MNNIAIILSGGVGNRMGSEISKQYIEIKGRPVIGYCLERFLAHRRINALIIGVVFCSAIPTICLPQRVLIVNIPIAFPADHLLFYTIS